MRPIGGRPRGLVAITTLPAVVVRTSTATTAASVAIPAVGTVLSIVTLRTILAVLLKRSLRTGGVLAFRSIGAIKGAVVAVRGFLAVGEWPFHGSLVTQRRRVPEAWPAFRRRLRTGGLAHLVAGFRAAFGARFVAGLSARLTPGFAARRFAGVATGGLAPGGASRTPSRGGRWSGAVIGIAGGRRGLGVRSGAAGLARTTGTGGVGCAPFRVAFAAGVTGRPADRCVEIWIVVPNGVGALPGARGAPAGRTFRFGHSTTASGTWAPDRRARPDGQSTASARPPQQELP